MIRFGARLSGIERLLLNKLSEANAAAANNSLRLATLKNINSARDNPTDFFQLSNFKSRLSLVNTTIGQVNLAATFGAEAQLTLDKVRTQLNSIRTSLLTDETRSLSAADRAAEQAIIDTAISEIRNLAGTEISGRRVLDGSANYIFSGLNNVQIRDLQVFSTIGTSSQTTAGSQAKLTHTGSNRKIAADTNITITGNLGSTTIGLNQDETLETAAARITAASGSTGVIAIADENKLIFYSSTSGAAASISIVSNTGALIVVDSKGNSIDTSVTTATENGSDAVLSTVSAVSGTVLQSAQQGTLAYTGVSGQTTAAATFDLTGKIGTATITVTNNQSLSTVADAINQESHKTGITAGVSGDILTFTTVDYGTKATLAISVTSGTLAVTGGNGDGTAQGVNAIAEINGRLIRGDTSATLVHTELTGQLTENINFRLRGDTGFFDFSFNATDTLATLETAIDAQTATTGVKASVSADGFDLILESVNRGAGSTVEVDVTSGTFAVKADDGSTISSLISAQRGELFLQSSTGLLTNNATIRITGNLGVNASDIAVTTGQTLLSVATLINAEKSNTGVEAKVVGDSLVIYSSETGDTQFAQIQVQSGTFGFTGGDGSGQDFGVDPLTTAIGVDSETSLTSVDGDRFSVNVNGFNFIVEFENAFTGDFSTVTVTDTPVPKFALSTSLNYITSLAIPSVLPERLGGISGTLAQLSTGGSLAGLDGNTSQAIRVIDEALEQLTLIEGRVDSFADTTVASSASLLDGFKTTLESAIDDIDKVNETEEALLLAKNQNLAANALSSLSIINQQRSGIIALIKQIAGLS